MNTLDLNGMWSLAWSDGHRGLKDRGVGPEMDPTWYLQAQVPGEIHLDLMRQGLLEDPRTGINILKARWVETLIWSYRKHFQVPPEALQGRCWLHCEQLDLAAKIFLNGQEVGLHCNSFYPCEIEVTGHLIKGTNRIVIQIDSGLVSMAEKPIQGLAKDIQSKYAKEMWMRKPHCQFSWDWSGRMINVGVSGDVKLLWGQEPIRADQLVPVIEVAEDLQSARVEARWHVEGLADEPVEAAMHLEIPELDARGTVPVKVEKGTGCCVASVEVSHPQLWWPVGHGDQKLYEMKARLEVAGKTVADEQMKIGFRRVRILQDPHPRQGRYFILEVNGRKIFAKGGNWVPADMIPAAVDRDRLDALLENALAANFNFLRIWGGGQYETEDFYSLCDEKGIMVWQDFIYACNQYPVHEETFYQDVKAEATWNVRRLARHASLVIWCGNNEMEWLREAGHTWGADWGYERTPTHSDYVLFHKTLPEILRAEDPSRFYWPSSPYSPDHRKPSDFAAGDQHPWIVSFVNTVEGQDFRRFRDIEPRFADEGGFLGSNSLPTTRQCLIPGQDKPLSFSWKLHDNTLWGNSMPFWLGRDRDSMSVEEYVYWAGLIQGEALGEYTGSFRRKMFDCAAAVFWMFNDTWPCTRSWTIVDFNLRRTPAFHPVRRAMAPVSVVLAEEEGEIRVYGVNDTREAIQGDLRFGLFELKGRYLHDQSVPAELAPNASTLLGSFSAKQWNRRESTGAFAVLADGDGNLLARNKLLDAFWKDIAWPDAKVDVEVEAGTARFACESFAMGICLDLDGELPLADNFFDVYPGQEYSIAWPFGGKPVVLHIANEISKF